MTYNKKSLVDPWNKNAKNRHEQILSGDDISFSKVLVPAVLNLIREKPKYCEFAALDVGCGSGIFTKILASNMRFVKGIDPSIKSIELAQKYLSDTSNVDLECIAIEDYKADLLHSFDLVVAHMTLHTILDIETAFQKIKENLKENSYFLFSIPHPCFYLEHKESVDLKTHQYHKERFYQIPFKISLDQKALPAKTPYFHRSIQQYTESLNKTDLAISRILEPFPDDSIMELYPPKKRWDYPHFMIFECKS